MEVGAVVMAEARVGKGQVEGEMEKEEMGVKAGVMGVRDQEGEEMEERDQEGEEMGEMDLEEGVREVRDREGGEREEMDQGEEGKEERDREGVERAEGGRGLSEVSRRADHGRIQPTLTRSEETPTRGSKREIGFEPESAFKI